MNLFTGVTLFDDDSSTEDHDQSSSSTTTNESVNTTPSERMKTWFYDHYHTLFTYHQQRRARLSELKTELAGESRSPPSSPLSRDDKKNMEHEHHVKETSYLRMLRKTTQKDFEPLFIYSSYKKDGANNNNNNIAKKQTPKGKNNKNNRRNETFTAASPELNKANNNNNSQMTTPVRSISQQHSTPITPFNHNNSAVPNTVVHTSRSPLSSPPTSPFISNDNLMEHFNGGTFRLSEHATKAGVRFSADTDSIPSPSSSSASGDGEFNLDRSNMRRTKSISSINKSKPRGSNVNLPATPQTPKNKSYTMMFKLDPKTKLEQAEKLLQEKEEDTRVAAEIGKTLLERNNELEDEIKTLKYRNHDQADQITRLKVVLNDNDRLRTDIMLLTSKVDSAMKENQLLSSREASLQDQLDQQQLWLRTEYSPLKAKTINQQLHEIQLLKMNVEHLQSSEDKLKKNRDRLAHQNESLSNSVADLQNALEDKVDQESYDAMKLKVKVLRDKNKDLKQRLKEMGNTSMTLASEPEAIIKSAFQELIKNEELLATIPQVANLRILSDAKILLRRVESEISTQGDCSLIAALFKYLDNEQQQQQQQQIEPINNHSSFLNESFESTTEVSDPKSALYMLICIVSIYKYTNYDKKKLESESNLIDELDSQVETLKRVIANLEYDLGEAKSLNLKLEEDIGQLKTPQPHVLSFADELKSAFHSDNHDKSLEELRKEHDQQITQLNQQHLSDSLELESLRHQYEKVTQLLEQQQRENKCLLESAAESTRNQLDQLDAKLRDNTDIWRTRLDSELLQKDTELQRLYTELEQTRKDAVEKETLVQQLTKQLDDQDQSIIQRQCSEKVAMDNILDQLRNTQQTMEGQASQIGQLEDKCTLLTKSNEEQNHSIVMHLSTIQMLKQDVVTLRDCSGQLQDRMDTFNNAVETNLCHLLTRFKSTEDNLDQLPAKVDALLQRIKQLENDHRVLQDTNVSLIRAAESMVVEHNDQQHKSVALLQEKLDQSVKQSIEMKAELDVLMASVQTERDGNAALVTENNTLKQNIGEMRRQLDQRNKEHRLSVKELSQQLTEMMEFVRKQKEEEDNTQSMVEVPSDSLTKDYHFEEELPLIQFINQRLKPCEEIKHVFPIDPSKHILHSFYDGVLMCKLVNFAREGTIDERVINMKPKRSIEVDQNFNLVANSARAIGCIIQNISPQTIRQDPKVTIMMINQLVRVHLESTITVANYPNLCLLKSSDEDIKHFVAQSASQLLQRWIHYQLEISNNNHNNKDKTKTSTFEELILDPSNCIKLLKKLLPEHSTDVCPDQADNVYKWFIQETSTKMNIFPWLSVDSMKNRNLKLAHLFVASFFLAIKDIGIRLEAKDKQVTLSFVKELSDLADVEGTREERAFCMWINSLNLTRYVNNLQQDLQDGLIILQMFDKIKTGVVNWKIVNQNPTNSYKMNENCDMGIDIAKKLKFSLIGIGGSDINAGNRKLTLALIWQACKYHLLSILQSLRASGSNRDVTESDIIRWANQKVTTIGKCSGITSFKDSNIGTGLFLVDLLESMSPGCINYSVVTKGDNANDRKLNAQYIINIARKLDCCIFLVWEDIVEVNQKMILTLVAQLYIKSEISNLIK
ncbi:hypothetical protein SAMD00019534_124930 [Acytostelium subglobosum LB1]|uniref:hypothetical protein n=1 Tax=Acytostelium subglobosum LB1 TaxID=1410327 RepID=UPI000644B8C1|nr:hypothetical protein SAMD00019534_124930 [Acytostelium subglobosum LB1]GAM29317.1 hypothetical protein SAMD00019534_124930 [Acytostelium subglobosum LB1]|eukprot:XP_012747744.1 hypothetical protein SAMD00019534_124930 [Acytostelium subglobosum LB1]